MSASDPRPNLAPGNPFSADSPSKPLNIHVVGVCGTGMGSLAGLLRELGHQVSGSDTAFDPPMGPALASWGVRCLDGFDPKHLEPTPDLVVIGNVCRANNPEARAAIDGGLPYTHIAGALARFYPVPGMAHCGGGPSTDRFDLFTPLVEWVEHGKAPSSVVATVRAENRELPQGWSATRSRPLCDWPKVARYRGAGDVESADSFRCE